MSEPSSLVMRVHLLPDAYQEFLSSPILPVRHLDDWQKISANFKQTWLDDIQYASMTNVRDWITALSHPSKHGPEALQQYEFVNTHVQYDSEQQCLNVEILEFSENLIEYAAALNVLRLASQFKPSSHSDFIQTNSIHFR